MLVWKKAEPAAPTVPAAKSPTKKPAAKAAPKDEVTLPDADPAKAVKK